MKKEKTKWPLKVCSIEIEKRQKRVPKEVKPKEVLRKVGSGADNTLVADYNFTADDDRK